MIKRADPQITKPSMPRTVVLPAAIACVEAVLFGTIGYFAVSFGFGTVCTDWFETGHHCDTLYHWLNAGAIGQWALAIAAAGILVLGLRRPSRRRAAGLIAWALIPLSLAWMLITSSLGRSSFKC
jgi:hypothetical protein